jgi:maleylpyruvate isomerase
MTSAPSPESFRPTDAIEGCKAAHARLLERIEAVDDVVLARPSRLPSWTVGHVLTHIARNADSFVRVLDAATVGEGVWQYPGGPEQRTGEIETGATRSAAAVVNDLRVSCERVVSAFEQARPELWSFERQLPDGSLDLCAAIPYRRWKEVEIHHVDLGLGYEPDDWPAGFVAAGLADSLAKLPGRIPELSQRAALLAWVTGRRETPGQIDIAPF